VAEVLYVLLQNIPLQAFESKSYLLMEDSAIKLIIIPVLLLDLLLSCIEQHMLRINNLLPRSDQRDSQVFPGECRQIVEYLN
jgi:hypothetical protein